ncbi:UNVERIFIED_CONTAM: hypothetical protein Sangu_3173400 [Sesamum angustifolium]|uniref:Uncharacterized protein n=1 Tax=Sesamum angustifolium TaxID=2727405 RepID=A0AAW2JVA7_9LAMI
MPSRQNEKAMEGPDYLHCKEAILSCVISLISESRNVQHGLSVVDSTRLEEKRESRVCLTSRLWQIFHLAGLFFAQ